MGARRSGERRRHDHPVGAGGLHAGKGKRVPGGRTDGRRVAFGVASKMMTSSLTAGWTSAPTASSMRSHHDARGSGRPTAGEADLLLDQARRAQVELRGMVRIFSRVVDRSATLSRSVRVGLSGASPSSGFMYRRFCWLSAADGGRLAKPWRAALRYRPASTRHLGTARSWPGDRAGARPVRLQRTALDPPSGPRGTRRSPRGAGCRPAGPGGRRGDRPRRLTRSDVHPPPLTGPCQSVDQLTGAAVRSLVEEMEDTA